jgi:hypothetical protein
MLTLRCFDLDYLANNNLNIVTGLIQSITESQFIRYLFVVYS